MRILSRFDPFSTLAPPPVLLDEIQVGELDLLVLLPVPTAAASRILRLLIQVRHRWLGRGRDGRDPDVGELELQEPRGRLEQVAGGELERAQTLTPGPVCR
jgi:hypothetical protein